MLTAPAMTALSVRELTSEADHAAWNAFVGSLPEGDVLQAWEWAGVKSPDWTPLRLAVFRDGMIVGGAALLRRTLPVVGSYLYGSRGPLLADWTDEAVFQALLDAIKAAAGNAAFLRLDPAVPVERTDVTALLTRHGFAPAGTTDAQGFGGMQPRCVMQLDLAGRSETEILASFKGQTRRNIKLGLEKHGVEIVSDTTRDDLTAFHALYAETAARDGFRPYSLAYFRQLWDSLVPAGMAKLFLTRYEGQWLSGAICFLIGDKCWYVFGASSNEHRNVMPNYAMQWAMIRWAKEHGLRLVRLPRRLPPPPPGGRVGRRGGKRRPLAGPEPLQGRLRHPLRRIHRRVRPGLQPPRLLGLHHRKAGRPETGAEAEGK